jgi:hypothetical protein
MIVADFRITNALSKIEENSQKQ